MPQQNAGTSRRRPLRAGDDQGSIAMALLLMMVGTMLAALLVPVVITQIDSTQVVNRRQHSLDAAQAGADLMVGRIRAARDAALNGDLSGLPCTAGTAPTGGPVTGKVSSSGAQRFEVKVYYFASDPQGHDEWIDNTSKQISCGPTGAARTPNYALIVSRGSDTATGSFDSIPTRTVEATYVFKTRNTNVAGGLIHSYGSNPDLCLDAGSSEPVSGTPVTFDRCAANVAQQMWSFNTNLTISLAGSADPASGDTGLCLDAPFPHSSGQFVTIKSCSLVTSRNQQWSFNGNNNFIATKIDGTQDSLCWNPLVQNTVGANLVLGSCGARDTAHAFQPEAAVGAGNADGSQKFLVDYNQFGRCLDVTNQALPQASDTKFLIAFPCKVSPDVSRPPTNQQWNFPTIATGATSASGVITSVMDPTYCLVSPRSYGSYPYMDKCSDVATINKTWTMWGDTGDYTTSYRITDSSTPVAGSAIGYCMQPTDPTATPADLFGAAKVSKIVLTTCSGATLQKWNAPPGVGPTSVRDYHEK